MTIRYHMQSGRLSGGYVTTYSTRHIKAAWRAYFATAIITGEKKRIIEIKSFSNGTSQQHVIKRDRSEAL